MKSCRQQGSMYDVIQLRYKAWFSLVMQAQAQTQA